MASAAMEQTRRECELQTVATSSIDKLVREEREAKIVLGDDATSTSTEAAELPCCNNGKDAGSKDSLDLDSVVDVVHLEDARNPLQRSLERSSHLLRKGGVIRRTQQLQQQRHQSSRLRSVVLKHMRLSQEILASLLDSSASLSFLSLVHCDYDMAMEEEANEEPDRESHHHLAKALQRHKHLQTVELKMLESACLVSIVRALVFSTSVQHLKLELKRSTASDDATAGALQHLLQSTPSTQRFELRSWSSIGFGSSSSNDNKGTNAFHSIVQGLTHSPTITDVRLCSCQLDKDDHESTLVLKNMMEAKSNLGSLSLQFCDVGDIREALVVLLSARSSLRCLVLEHCNLRVMFPHPCDFVHLLRAVVDSRPLERLVLGCIQSPLHLQALAQSLPTMRIRELEVRVGLGLWHKKAELLEAIQRNYSLLQPVRAGELFVVEADRKKLREIAARNLSLKEWTVNPEEIPLSLWPKAFQGASRLGSTAALRALIGAEKLGP